MRANSVRSKNKFLSYTLIALFVVGFFVVPLSLLIPEAKALETMDLELKWTSPRLSSGVESPLIVDIDGDGDLDMVLHFRVQDTNLAEIYAENSGYLVDTFTLTGDSSDWLVSQDIPSISIVTDPDHGDATADEPSRDRDEYCDTEGEPTAFGLEHRIHVAE